MNELEYFINETLESEPTPVTSKKLEMVICDEFGVTMDEIKSKTRKQNVVYARQFYIYFMWEKNLIRTKLNLAKSINRTHATVIYAITKLEHWVNCYDDVKHIYERINHQLEYN
jgi:chromosomal replication initiator protein